MGLGAAGMGRWARAAASTCRQDFFLSYPVVAVVPVVYRADSQSSSIIDSTAGPLAPPTLFPRYTASTPSGVHTKLPFQG